MHRALLREEILVNLSELLLVCGEAGVDVGARGGSDGGSDRGSSSDGGGGDGVCAVRVGVRRVHGRDGH